LCANAFAISDYIETVLASQTKKGLLLLMIGITVSAFPIVRPVGSLIALAGFIWFLLGRDIFGEKHSKQVLRASAIFAVGSFLVLVGSIGYILFVLSISGPSFPGYWWGNNALAWALVPSLTLLLEIETIGIIATGAAYGLFAYYLAKPAQRAILVAALVINIVIGIIIYSILSSDVSSTLIPNSPNLLSAFYPGNADPAVAHAFENQVLALNLLNLIPAVMYLTAYYTIYSRIKTDYPFD
jgi:hypothetical protein